VAVSREALEELRTKYAEILALRLAHAAGDPTDPRRRMAALASRFPGALRETDDLELDVIRARIERLGEVLRGEASPEPWMEAIAMFHALTRGALCAKKWLSRRDPLEPDVAIAFEVEHTAMLYAEDARVWRDDLVRLASPPRGRVTELVFERIAIALGRDLDEARRLVFGTPRRERR
jgi:hypothetical protein